MSYVKSLPSELWLHIFETIITSSLDPNVVCDPLTCSEIESHLYHPWDYGPPCNKARQNLRLVCRTFNAILVSPNPFQCIMADLDTPIPPRSRAVYIKYSEDARLNFQRLLTEPSICNQIVTLALPGNQRGHSVQPQLFDTLCENSGALCHLRNLTLGLFLSSMSGRGSIPRFWSRLNSSFPHLICIVLRGEIRSEDEDPVVTFKELEVLDSDSSHPSGIQFPALRHAACTRIDFLGRWKSSWGHRWFAGWPHMESLLIREGSHKWIMGWDDLPGLRILRIPVKGMLGFTPLPANHPLQHIYIEIGTMDDYHFFPISELTRQYDELRFIKLVNKLFPSIPWVTLVLKTPKKGGKDGMVGDFDAKSLALIGFTVNASASGPYWGGRRIVLERIQLPSRSERLAAGFHAFRKATIQFKPLPAHSIVGIAKQ